MERWDAVELNSLVEALREADPLAPTLCEGWEARHLLAHLQLRRHRPWLAFRQGPGSAFAELADRAADPAVYADLVEKFAEPPSRLTPMGLADGPLGMQTNFLEYVIHHEDLRRGAGSAAPRAVPAAEADALFDSLAMFGRLQLRRYPVGVVLAVPGGRRRVVRRSPESVAVLGSPVELALVVTGRRRAADVEILGDDDAVAAFEAAAA